VFQEADTVAIFQFESSGMRDYLKRLKPTVFEDLVAMNALYRPGPMENIPYFIDCKHGKQVARYEHPALEPILKGTYGVFVYQEQVMRAAHDLAGLSLAVADELRRAMGKKLQEEMESKRRQFVEGCVKNGLPAGKAEKIFQTMEKFAGYGFNKCAARDTAIIDALSGERTTVGELFERPRPFTVHALGDDWRLVPRLVTDVMANGRKPVFELTTDLGHRITATGNHPFRTLEGWKNLEKLGPGDRIAAPRHLPIDTQKSWPRHELIALAGLIAEGNTCHPSSLYFFGNEWSLVEDFATAISSFPDTVARIYARGDGRLEVCANRGRPGVARDGEFISYGDIHGNLALALVEDAPGIRSGAFRWAERLGIIGRKATEKRVPEEIFTLRDADIALFLGRLWAGNGFFANARLAVPYYATSSPRLARDVQTLLLRLGMVSRVREKSFKYRGGRRRGFTVGLLGETSIDRFFQTVVPHQVGRDRAVAHLAEHLRSTTRGLTSKDTIPEDVKQWANDERLRAGLMWKQVAEGAGVSVQRFQDRRVNCRRGLRRSTIARLAKFFASMRLARLAESDVYWDRVVSIEARGEQETFDLTVEHDHNFVADGLIVHNSHSAAYALLAYQCAWLKAHHPVEFMAATLTSEMSDSARIVTLIEEARRMGIEILPPDVARSEWKFTLEGDRIRFGLGAVRNVGASAVEALVAARASGEPFTDLFELARRLDGRAVNRRALESLVAAGACDPLGPERGALSAGVALALDHAAALQRDRLSGQASLFGGEPGAVAVSAPPLPSTPPWSGRDRSAKEKEVLGFYFSEHPLEQRREALARVASHTVADALTLEDGAEARLAGVLIEVRTITTRAGKRMAALVLEDLTGRIECTVFPELFEVSRELLVADEVVVLSGRIEIRDDRGLKLLVSEAKRFEEASAVYRPALHIEIRAEELSARQLEGVDEVLRSHPGEAEVYLHIVKPDHSRLAMRSRRFRVREHEDVAAALRGRFPSLRVRWGKGAP
ncbi:MAG: LAGLIDADG family homing endonuclease, partial [Candidatus Eiseniibacteriota bacterium]